TFLAFGFKPLATPWLRKRLVHRVTISQGVPIDGCRHDCVALGIESETNESAAIENRPAPCCVSGASLRRRSSTECVSFPGARELLPVRMRWRHLDGAALLLQNRRAGKPSPPSNPLP